MEAYRKLESSGSFLASSSASFLRDCPQEEGPNGPSYGWINEMFLT